VARLLAKLRLIRWAQRLRQLYALSPWLPPVIDRVAGWLGGKMRSPSKTFHRFVGQYVIRLEGRTHRVCIDSSDPGQLASDALVAWSDVYFKDELLA
jgi:hypothetical protein